MDNPQMYVKSNSMQRQDTHEILNQYRNYFQWGKGERVLDVGCGPGDVTVTELLPFLPEDSFMVGCDISEEMVKYANENNTTKRTSFQTLDIQQKDSSISKQTESFDKIFSFYCLHWIHDHRQAMKNIYSLLKPNGDILLMFLTPDNPVYLAIEKMKVSQKWLKYTREVKWFYETEDPPKFFENILKDVGFQNINCYLKKGGYKFSSWDSVLDFLESVTPYLRFLPADLKSEYKNDLADLLKQENHIICDEKKGEFVTEYNLIVIIAKKPKENRYY